MYESAGQWTSATLEGAPIDSGSYKRNSWLACPRCGHKVAKAKTCDIEFKCKHCGYEFEVIIGPIPAQAPDEGPRSSADPETKSSL